MRQRREVMTDWRSFRGDFPAMMSIGHPPAYYKATTYIPPREAYLTRLQQAGTSQHTERLLPMLEQAHDVGNPRFTGYLWHRGKTVRDNLISILDEAAKLLHEDAFNDIRDTQPPSHTRFLHPMVFHRAADARAGTSASEREAASEKTIHPCMLFSQAKLKGVHNFRMVPGGYVLAVIGMKHGIGQCIEGMHRLIMYAIYGPPPEGCSVVMHACERAMCGNPMHLLWGTQSQNLEKSRATYARLLMEQHGVNALA